MVYHDIEKSEVFSLGMTILSVIANTQIGTLQTLNCKAGQPKIKEELKKVESEGIKNILANMLLHDEEKRWDYDTT